MKQNIKVFLTGALAMALVLGLTISALAISGRMTIEIDPINIQVNGETFRPKDVNGNEVPVFAYNGTTYAPLRALAEAYGLTVGWNPESNLATVTAPKVEKNSTPADDNQEEETMVGEENGTDTINLTETSSFGFVSVDGKRYQIVYSYESKDPRFIKGGLLKWDKNKPEEIYFSFTDSDKFSSGNFLPLLTNSFRTTTTNNQYVDGAIDMFMTGYHGNKIAFNADRQYKSASEYEFVYEHSYMGKTLTIDSTQRTEHGAGELFSINAVRFAYTKDGLYVNLKDYCSYMGIKADVKVEYSDDIKGNLLIVDH